MISIFIPSSGTIDVSENEAFPITWNIADVKTPDNRNTNYTKTLRLPGTANNNKLFGWLFDVNIQANRFNPNLKVSCVVLNDSIPILSGFIQLLSIDVKDEKDVVYECSITGNTGDLFTNIGNRDLRDLDLSLYDHTFNYSNISNSWSAPVGVGYVYPQIDYGIYDLDNLKLEDDMKPAIYAKTYLDRILSTAGFTHNSTFLNSDFFKRLIVPFNGDVIKLSDNEIKNRRVVASVTGSKITGSFGTAGYVNMSCNTETTDLLGQYNGTKLTLNKAGTYNLAVNHKYSFKYNSSVVQTQVYIYPEVIRVRNGVTATLQTAVLNCRTTAASGVYFSGLLTSPSAGAETASFDYNTEITLALEAGDEVYIRTYMPSISNMALQQETGSNFELSINPGQIIVGATLSINSCIPENIKQRDFLKSIINHFNLYVDVDKSNPKRLIIEPRADFYSSGTVRDWSSKWDAGNGWTITPMGELDAKEYHYTYKQDSDYFNDEYNKKWNLVYGKKEWKITNDYIKNIKTTELIFSPTPLVKRGNRILSTILKKDSSGNAIKTKHNIRLLYYAGLKTCLPYNVLTTSGASQQIGLTSYPFAGHLDDANWPSLDLNFGAPKEVFYSTDPFIFTDNNSFNRYYKNFIDEITDENSKIVKGKFNLSAYDFQIFDFRDTVLVDNAYWRVNKIEFDPTNNELADVELIKIKNLPTFAPSSGQIFSSSGETFLPYDYNPVSRQRGANTFSDSHLVRGYNIFVADNAINVIATGEDLSIGDSKNVTLLNSSGVTVAGGLQNVYVINSSGITVTESNVSYVDGVKTSTTLGNYVPYVGSSGTVDLGSQKILIGNGSVSSPSLAFSGTTNSGFWKNTNFNAFSWGSGGSFGGIFEASGLYVKSTAAFAFLSSDAENASADVLLRRAAARTLILGQNGGALQNKFRVQGDATDYIEITHDGTNAIITTNAGSILLSGTNIGIGTSSPSSSALVDLTSTTQGLLLPRMTATQGSAITGVNGLMIYVTDTNGTFTSVGFWGYENGAWIKL